MVMPVTVDSTDKTITLYLSRDKCGGKFGINWGDGTYEEEESSVWTVGSKHHTYANAGSYEIKVYAETEYYTEFYQVTKTIVNSR